MIEERKTIPIEEDTKCEKFSEEKGNCIIEMVRKLCVDEDHKDPLECQDCLEFDHCKMYEYCIKLYDFILHREEEIQKKTAREILLRVKSFLEEQTKTVKQLSKPSMGNYAIPRNCVECYEGSQDNRLNELNRIAKKFGVEVEESGPIIEQEQEAMVQ